MHTIKNLKKKKLLMPRKLASDPKFPRLKKKSKKNKTQRQRLYISIVKKNREKDFSKKKFNLTNKNILNRSIFQN